MDRNLHTLIPDEVTIRILSRKSETYQLAPPELKKPYWVTLGEGGAVDAAFDTLDDALTYIYKQAMSYMAATQPKPDDQQNR